MSSSPAVGAQEAPKREPIQKFKGHTDLVLGVIHLPDGQRIMTCSLDGSLRLWNLKNGLQIGKNWEDGKSPVITIALSPDGKTVVTGSSDHAVRLWDIETGKVIAKWTGHSDFVSSVCWSCDGRRVVSGSQDTTTKVWNVENGEIIRSINSDATRSRGVAYSPDNTMIAIGDHTGIEIWNAKTFELRRKLTPQVWVCRGLAWAAHGKTIICGSHDGSITTWNTTTWGRTATLAGHSDCVFAIAISPNNRILASASLDNTAQLWNMEDDQPIGLPLQHPNALECISFSADGRLLATGCRDNNAYTWDAAAIVIEAGFNDLLVDPDTSQSSVGKSFLDVNTTPCPSRSINNTRRLPQGFLDDTGNHTHSSSTRSPRPSSTRQYLALRPRVLLDRILLLSHRSNPISPPLPLARQPRLDSKRRPTEVEVPYTQGQPRNVNARANSKGKTSVSGNILTMSVAGPSRQPLSGVAQRSSEGPLRQQSSSRSQPQPSIVPAITTSAVTTSTTAAHMPSESASDVVVIRQVGCWTRFRLFLCCISTRDHR